MREIEFDFCSQGDTAVPDDAQWKLNINDGTKHLSQKHVQVMLDSDTLQ